MSRNVKFLRLLLAAVGQRSVFALPEDGTDGPGGLVFVLAERDRIDQLRTVMKSLVT